jgi:hypothetical protein
MRNTCRFWLPLFVLGIATTTVNAQSFRVQCPPSTITHPGNNNAEPEYTEPTVYKCSVDGGCHGYESSVSNAGGNNTGYLIPAGGANGAVKCQQISGGDGFSTMADGTQTYMFSFGPLSGLADIANGQPGTQFPNVFNTVYPQDGAPLLPGDPATTDSSGGNFGYNGAIGLVPDLSYNTVNLAISSMSETGHIVNFTVPASPNLSVGDTVIVSGVTPADYNGMHTISAVLSAGHYQFLLPNSGVGNGGAGGNVAIPPVDGHVDPRQIMDIAVMNGNIPAPLMAIDEDDEFFLTLTNVGQIMRPDLFEQHTVHFHGYPNASTFYDGVPDASVAINIGGSFTYYYLAPDAGTYFWHCHITPPEHLQMGMVGQIYVRPRQNRVPKGSSLVASLENQQSDLRTACRRPGDGASPSVTSVPDILCSNPVPAGSPTATHDLDRLGNLHKYAYNDGDASTAYDVEYPIQIHGFDPNFHFVGMTFNPEGFADMKDKYFLLNGRSYPDTVTAGPLQTQTADGASHFSQPLPAIINIPSGGRALLRISDLDVSEYQTLASLGIPMHVIALNAKMLRDEEGNNMAYDTNSITLGGGESLDVILDASNVPSGTYYLYTPNLDHLANDAENFGGLMTEVHVCGGSVTGPTFGNTCSN